MEDNAKLERSSIAVILNGKRRDVASDQTIAGLLDDLDLRERLVVVERNGSIVNRADFATTSLEVGDVLEVVHFVGGG
ncbi:MAG TPA: sulfur carrier protein ThiS [Thermomicrobiales bacterium]|nr:sulfur carrier protein ThiS [Thermomicrobiales bacterium]